MHSSRASLNVDFAHLKCCLVGINESVFLYRMVMKIESAVTIKKKKKEYLQKKNQLDDMYYKLLKQNETITRGLIEHNS